MPEIREELINIESVTGDPTNTKIHTKSQLQRIKKSIGKYGYNNYISVDENYKILEGHGRLKALESLGYKKINCYVINGLTEAQKEVYRVMSNKLCLDTGLDLCVLKDYKDQIVSCDVLLDSLDKRSVKELTLDTSVELKSLELVYSNKSDRDDVKQLSDYATALGDGDVWEGLRLLVYQNFDDVLVGGPIDGN